MEQIRSLRPRGPARPGSEGLAAGEIRKLQQIRKGAPVFIGCSACRRQSFHNLFRHSVGARGDLPRRLVLNRVFDIDGVKAGASQGAGLYPRRGGELRGCHRNRGYPEVFQLDGIVQTARGA